MGYQPRPRPSILDEYECFGMRGGRQVWTNADRTRFFTWDSRHGNVEDSMAVAGTLACSML